jgi:hypothetical protein
MDAALRIHWQSSNRMQHHLYLTALPQWNHTYRGVDSVQAC